MTEHGSRQHRDARAPDRRPHPGLSRAMVMAAVTDVALFWLFTDLSTRV